MCEFVSWKKYKENLYYLDNDKLNTKDGRDLLKYLKDNNSLYDICGHGAIEKYYPELKDKLVDNIEVTDFSSPDNFPKEISDKIKQGKFSDIILEEYPLELLNDKGRKQYNKIKQSALEQYNKIKQPALEQYNKIKQSAWEQYNKIEQPAWEQYNKIEQSASEQYNKIKQSAFWKTFENKKYRNIKWI